MPNGTDATNRTDRGRPDRSGVEPTFSEEQRIWLLERDLDDQDKEFEKLRSEVHGFRSEIRTRLWWLTGIGFSVLISVLGVLVAVIASRP